MAQVFKDRAHAGKELALLLEKYHDDKNTIIIGLPRGGVVTGYAVAKALHLPLDIVCPRKVGAPGNPEYAIGAVTETGEAILNEPVIADIGIPEQYLKETLESEKQQALMRLHLYRKGLPPRNFHGKNIIIVDDGMATGHTMKAAIKSVKAEGAKAIIVAVPVTPPDTVEEIRETVDEVVYLEAPPFFAAVGQFYQNFAATTDEEVIALLQGNDTAETTHL